MASKKKQLKKAEPMIRLPRVTGCRKYEDCPMLGEMSESESRVALGIALSRKKRP